MASDSSDASPWSSDDAPTSPQGAPLSGPGAVRSGSSVSAAAPAGTQQPPASIPDFDLLRCIGSGATGDVWIARNRHSGQFRVIKFVVRAGATELEGIRRFLQCVGDHPNLVPIEHVGEAAGCIYEVMPIADSAASVGPLMDASQYEALTLQAYFRRHAPVPVPELADLARQLASAIDHLHRQGVVHCDIKPANIVRLGGTWRLADHGLASTTDQQLPTGFTPGYALESEMGTRAADLYALGVVLMQASAPARADEADRFVKEEIRVTSPGTERSRRVVQHALIRILDPASTARSMTALHLVEPIERAAARRAGAGMRPSVLALGLAVVAVAGAAWLVQWTISHRPERDVPAGAGSASQGTPGRPPPHPGGVVEGGGAEGFAPTFATARIKSFHVIEPRGADAKPGDAIVSIVGAHVGEMVEVELVLEAPGFAYIFAVDPRGDARLVWPPSPEIPPPRLDVMPPRDKPHGIRLERGMGAWGFFAVASGKPLPPWREWNSAGLAMPATWPKALDWLGDRSKTPLACFESDGTTTETITAPRGPRRRDATVTPPQAFVDMMTNLKSHSGGDAVHGALFPCLPEPVGGANRPRAGSTP